MVRIASPFLPLYIHYCLLGTGGWQVGKGWLAFCCFSGDQNQNGWGVIDKDDWAFWQAGGFLIWCFFLLWLLDGWLHVVGGRRKDGWAGICAGVSLLFFLPCLMTTDGKRQHTSSWFYMAMMKWPCPSHTHKCQQLSLQWSLSPSWSCSLVDPFCLCSARYKSERGKGLLCNSATVGGGKGAGGRGTRG